MKKPILAIDPGHGRRKGSKGYDPGVIDPRGRHEAELALEMALTLKFRARERGWVPFLTHQGTETGKGNLRHRIQRAIGVGAAAFVSIHANMVGSYDLVFFSTNHRPSYDLALKVARSCGIPYSRIWPSSRSNFKGLYIDLFPSTGKPAILWEVAAVENMPELGAKGREERIKLADKFLDGLEPLRRSLMNAQIRGDDA